MEFISMETMKDLAAELVHKAESGQHRQFQFLRSWQEYSEIKELQRAHVLLTSSINKSANRLFNNYCKSVTAGTADVFNILAYSRTIDILNFYKEELDILTNMIYEYEAYLMEGNLIDAWLFNDYRPDNKLWDHRGA
jgi:hypothetical protein